MSSNLTLIWTSTALADLQRLRSFIAQHNPHAAGRAAQTIKQAAIRLLDHPELGKLLDGREDRELFIPFGQQRLCAALSFALQSHCYLKIVAWS